jgi:hypothetical protein
MNTPSTTGSTATYYGTEISQGRRLGTISIVAFLGLVIGIILLVRGQNLPLGETVLVSLQVVLLLLPFAGVFPLTYVAYLYFRAPAKKQILAHDFYLLGLSDRPDPKSIESLYQTTYSPIQFIVFIILIMACCLTVSLVQYSGEIIAVLEGKPELFFPTKLPPPLLMAVFFSFLGAYVYSVQELIRRFNTYDLRPQVYGSILVRILVATGVSIAAVGLIPKENGELLTYAPAIFFTIGMFPERGIRWIEKSASIVLGAKRDPASRRPLDGVIGISSLHESRLLEIGIDDAQNLATADIRKLLLTTPFDTQQIVNWIDQSILYVEAGANIDDFRQLGITTYHQLQRFTSVIGQKELSPDDNAPETQDEVVVKVATDFGRFSDPSNYPNYLQITEYYERTKREAEH